MNFIPVVEHAPTLTVCLSLTNFKTHQPEGPMKFLVWQVIVKVVMGPP